MRGYSCPECRETFNIKPDLKRNLRLNNIAESFQSADQVKKGIRNSCTNCIQSPIPAVKTCLLCEASLCENHLRVHSKSAEHVLTEPTTSLENRKCSVHKKVLEFYCCEDAACICVSCRLDGEHRGHQVETLSEASEKKEKLRNILQKLTTHFSTKGFFLPVCREMPGPHCACAWWTYVTQPANQAGARHFSTNGHFSTEHLQLEIKKEELTKKMGDIEEICDMTDPVTVLQGRESGRADYCDSEKPDIKVLDVGDLDVGQISVTLHTGLAGILTRISRRRQEPEVSDMLVGVNTALFMLLDEKTAGNYVSVSGDLKTVSWTEIKQRCPETPERFQDFPQVLSSRSFSSGRHYWEVEVSESGGWVVGMAYPSIERRGWQSLVGENNKSWSLFRWDDNQYSVIHDSNVILLPDLPSCGRLWIFLDYEAGRLSFFELCDPIRLLHTFTAAFTEPLHAVVGVYGYNYWVRI
uniref:Uncharacterized protein n=1 Tax=Leptobrachium leishanense TaxID=445787 RepID=A0A8C5QCR1_9ANUR